MAGDFEIDIDAIKDLESAKAIIRVLIARMKVLEEKKLVQGNPRHQ